MELYSKKHEKETMMFLHIITVLYLIAIAVNIALPVYSESFMNTVIFTPFIIIFWTYGFICSRGYFKKIVSKGVDGRIQYTTRTPIVQVGMLRIIEFVWLVLQKKHGVNFRNLLIQVVLDVLLLAIMLIDKSAYYYESRMEEDE